MVATRPGAFTLRCLLDDCNRMRAFQYLNGRIDLELSGRGLPYYNEMKLHPGSLETAADLVRDAVDLHLMGQMNTDAGAKDAAYRGAAVHLRIAAQIFVGGYIMGLDPNRLRQRGHSLGPLIGKLRKKVGRSKIRTGRKKIVLGSLDYILRLGDTAAHLLLEDETRELPPTRGNLEIGFDQFDKVIASVRLP